MSEQRQANLSEARIEIIVRALFLADSGQEIYEAFNQVPTENLIEMHKIIMHILSNREKEDSK